VAKEVTAVKSVQKERNDEAAAQKKQRHFQELQVTFPARRSFRFVAKQASRCVYTL
jgi:hypothetical protein